MSIIKNVKRDLNYFGMKIKKNSPEIKHIIGMASGIGAIITAGQAGYNIKKRLVKRKIDKLEIENKKKEDKKYNPKNDESKSKKELVKGIVLDCAPTAVLTGSYVYFTNSAFNEYKTRYMDTVATLAGVSASYLAYRNRVKEKYGEEEEANIYYGRTKATVTDFNEDDIPTVKDEYHISEDIEGLSPYAIIYKRKLPNGSVNPNWDDNMDFIMQFLHFQEEYANKLLYDRGYLFLNEVFDLIGYPATKAGAVVGWYLNNGGDDRVDFGLQHNLRSEVKTFFKGEKVILLDFNVDGVIFDLLSDI